MTIDEKTLLQARHGEAEKKVKDAWNYVMICMDKLERAKIVHLEFLAQFNLIDMELAMEDKFTVIKDRPKKKHKFTNAELHELLKQLNENEPT